MKIKPLDTNGFTLIEAIISLAVLSIGILALFSMQTLGIRANANANRVTSLTTRGSDIIEDKIIKEQYSNIKTTDTNPCPTLVDNQPKFIEKNRTVLNDTPIENVKTIDIIVIKCLNGVTEGKDLVLRYLKTDPKS